ncbi:MULTISPECIES: hypothetical protein [Ralstonia solanacearum species complex]|uniref:hypothetical protein n=1 Tax=Ralstonia solanacearum species complex TaxID=3116862 RepID=UPI0013C33E22|nr:hypothetical protein [Ralstonia solanacearum]
MENLAILSGPTLNPVNLQGDTPCPAAAYPARQQRGGQQCLQSGREQTDTASTKSCRHGSIGIEQRKLGEARRHDGSSLRHHGSSGRQSAKRY